MTLTSIEHEIQQSENPELGEEILQAKELMLTFAKTIQAFRMYPAVNPTPQLFLDNLGKAFKKFLWKYGSFHFSVEEQSFSYHEQVIYESPDLRNSLSFLLFKDGMRELHFTEGLEFAEIQQLVAIFAHIDDIDYMEDDFVTILWEKDFEHISYVAIDEYLGFAPNFIAEDSTVQRLHDTLTPLPEYVDEETWRQYSRPTETPAQLPSNRLITRGEVPASVIYELTTAEEEQLRHQVDEAVNANYEFEITNILFELLAIATDPDAYRDTLYMLGKAIDSYVMAENLRGAADILQRLYQLPVQDSPEYQEIIQSFYTELGAAPRLEQIARLLTRDETRFSDASTYFAVLQANVIPALMNLLGELTSADARKKLCDLLATIGKGSITPFIPFLSDQRWYLVRNAVYILGRTGDARAIPYLEKTFDHENIEVQREILRALEAIGNNRSMKTYLRAIRSTDSYLRCMAAVMLGKAGGPLGLRYLLEAVQSRQFAEREAVEIKSFLSALGANGSTEALETLQKLLFRRSWLRRRGLHDIHQGAAEALAKLDTPEARQALEKGKASRDASISAACRQAETKGMP